MKQYLAVSVYSPVYLDVGRSMRHYLSILIVLGQVGKLAVAARRTTIMPKQSPPPPSIDLLALPAIPTPADLADEKSSLARGDDRAAKESLLAQLSEKFTAAAPQRTFSPAELQ